LKTGQRLPGNLLLVGNINYDSQPGRSDVAQANVLASSRSLPAGAMHFQPLQGTREEVAAIEKLYHQDFGKEGILLLQEFQATKATVLAEAGRYRYLHLATHGFFIEEKLTAPAAMAQRGAALFGAESPGGPQSAALHPGLLSGLALAGANRTLQADAGGAADNQGVVTAEEIASQNLEGVELVMLSACETGLGKASAGEGLLGLQRAFQSAGARSVVASLWSVPDEETRALMELFYANLWQRHLSPLESLRQAQLTMLHAAAKAGGERGFHRIDSQPGTSSGTRSPYYWAAFVLSGDWR
jgi:CHAT domain-containing protein